MPFDRKRYSPDWPAIRAAILQRAGNRCEVCGTPQYAVGYRDAWGDFHPLGGTPERAAGGRGELSFREASKLLWAGDDGGHFVIVLTIAHLNHDPLDNEAANLMALCQYHHLNHDRPMHQRVRRWRREQRRLRQQPVLELD